MVCASRPNCDQHHRCFAATRAKSTLQHVAAELKAAAFSDEAVNLAVPCK
jgi:hypothetical protein